jgi:hypothetical protein
MILSVNFKNSLIVENSFNSDIIKTIHASFPIAVKQVKQNDFYKYFDFGTAEKTAKAVWLFLRNYIVYKRDEDDKQQILLPGRLIYERSSFSDGFNNNQSSDCKSYALFAAAIMAANGYKVGFRYTSYRASETPTHVYTFLPDENIIIDGCYKLFNEEKKYTFKKDHIMNTYVLSGINGKKKGGKKKGGKKTVKKIALSVPRNSFLGLVKLNVFGLATKLLAARKKDPKKVEALWKKLGGNINALNKEIDRGAKKKAILGGKKTKEIAKGLKGIDDPALRQKLRAQVKQLIEVRKKYEKGDPRIEEITQRIRILKDSITGINEVATGATFAAVAAAAAPVLVAVSQMFKNLGIGKGNPDDPNDISVTDILDTAAAAGGEMVNVGSDEFEVTDKDKGSMGISPIILIAGLGAAAFLFLRKK